MAKRDAPKAAVRPRDVRPAPAASGDPGVPSAPPAGGSDLLRLLPDELTLVRTAFNPTGDADYQIAGYVAIDPRCSYESLRVHVGLRGAGGQLLYFVDAYADGVCAGAEKVPFGARFSVPAFLTEKAREFVVRVVARAIDLEAEATFALPRHGRVHGEARPTRADAHPAVPLTVGRTRPDSSDDVTVEVIGECPALAGRRHEQVRVETTLRGAKGEHVRYDDSNCDVRSLTAAPRLFRAWFYLKRQLAASVATVHVRVTAQSEAADAFVVIPADRVLVAPSEA